MDDNGQGDRQLYARYQWGVSNVSSHETTSKEMEFLQNNLPPHIRRKADDEVFACVHACVRLLSKYLMNSTTI